MVSNLTMTILGQITCAWKIGQSDLIHDNNSQVILHKCTKFHNDIKLNHNICQKSPMHEK